MENLGFIRDKLDIKLLILYVLKRLPDAVDRSVLSELVMIDGGIGYFDYSDSLSELTATGHITESGGKYRITEKGERNGSAVESSLPFSVRQKTDRAIAPVALALERKNMVRASHTQSAEGCVVSLALSDGIGEVLTLNLLVPDETSAQRIEAVFRENAEGIHGKILAMFSGQ